MKKTHKQLLITVIAFFIMGVIPSFFLSKKLLPKKPCEKCKEKKCDPIKKCEPVKCPTCKKCLPDAFCKTNATKYTEQLNKKLTDVYYKFSDQLDRGEKEDMIKEQLVHRQNGLESIYTKATLSDESGVWGT